MVIVGAVQAGHIWVAALALFTAVLTMFYLFKVFSAVFLGEQKSDHREGTRSMVFVVVLLAILSLLAGFLVAYPMKLINIATGEILRWMP
jgi:NADH:ubiquinone oxidoreductase subunit 5 (subunit L)/multisubunit Na+/H+ antiporter MnhA subunit